MCWQHRLSPACLASEMNVSVECSRKAFGLGGRQSGPRLGLALTSFATLSQERNPIEFFFFYL